MRRVVLTKILLTAVIAGLGSLIVYAGSRAGSTQAMVAGLAIVALSPIISYLIVLRRLGG